MLIKSSQIVKRFVDGIETSLKEYVVEGYLDNDVAVYLDLASGELINPDGEKHLDYYSQEKLEYFVKKQEQNIEL